MPVDKELLKILACPKCKGKLDKNAKFLTCSKCRLAYPVIENIPNMLIEEAWTLDKAEKSKFQHQLKL